jgi:hypothetical protein
MTKMHPYIAQRQAEERARQLRAEASRRRPAARTGRTIRNMTGRALIRIGLALVTPSARRQHQIASPELP